MFIAPWQAAAVPRNWISALDRHGMILVTAANSGNTENVLERRIPLALLAAHNVMQRYPVDKDRLYIGGMSGGSRVALRIALAFPDVFHALLLHSGSDRVGTAEAPLPSAGLFKQFQEMRLVYLTGENDRVNLDTDVESRASLQYWCAYDIDVEPFPFSGHELAGARDIRPGADRSWRSRARASPTGLQAAERTAKRKSASNCRKSRICSDAANRAMPGRCCNKLTFALPVSRRQGALSSHRNCMSTLHPSRALRYAIFRVVETTA